MTPTILNPVRTRIINGQTVEVREFKALTLLAILKTFNGHLAKFANEKGELKLTVGNFQEAVLGTEDLFITILTSATGQPADWLADLGLSDALDLLADVVEINKEVFAKKGGAVVAAFKSGMTTTPMMPN